MGMIIPKEKSTDELFVLSLYLDENKTELILLFHRAYPSCVLDSCPNGSFLAVAASQGSRIRFSHGCQGTIDRRPAASHRLCTTAREKRDERIGRERFPITGTFRSGIPFRTSLFSRRAPRTGL